MSIPRRHHYIPLMLQRRFVGSDGCLYLLDKRRKDSGVVSTSPHNAFVQRDLNTIELKDGSKHVGLETWYSRLEGEVSPIIDQIVNAVRAGKRPGLTQQERTVWDTFFYHQQKRAPDAFERLGLVHEFRNNLTSWLDRFEQRHGPIAEHERNVVQSDEVKRRMVQYATVRARSQGGAPVLEALASRGLAIAIIQSPKKSFILGDYPQSRMGPTSDLRDPLTELWMPVAPDVAVSPWGEPTQELLCPLAADQVRRMNRVIFDQSNVVASRSQELLLSLATL